MKRPANLAGLFRFRRWPAEVVAWMVELRSCSISSKTILEFSGDNVLFLTLSI
jgi:hypothetical protein